jgi:KaiC/GvpD/RAD55 family RecA-like ATPase
MATGDDNRIPSCVGEFLRSSGGRSLIVKGASGTGKTTFSLQCIECVGQMNTSFYITTRVSDEALYSQFGWLRDKEWKERIFDASRGFLRAILPAIEDYEGIRLLKGQDDDAEDSVITASKTFLKTVYKDISGRPMRIERRHLENLALTNDIPELVQLYDRVEMVFPNEALVVLDSLNGLAEKYNIPMTKIIQTIQKDLVENAMTKVIIVLENEELTDLDYLVDGVVRLSRGEVDSRRIREMHVEKLRGVEIHMPKYLFTLTGGRFMFLPEFTVTKVDEEEGWENVEEKGELLSSGSPDLDDLLGGGFPPGSNVLVDVLDNLPNEAHVLITGPLIANFISKGRGVMVVPFHEMSSDDVVDLGKRMMEGDEAFTLLRVAEKIYFEKARDEPHILALSFEDAAKDYEKWRREAGRLKQETGKPLLEIIAVETQEARLGEEDYKSTLSLSAEMGRKGGDLIVRLSKPGLERITQRVANHSNIHLKMRRLNGAVIIYGERPHTKIYAVDAGQSMGHFRLHLVPIV